MLTPSERVLNSIKLLDEKGPTGWRDTLRSNVDRLDITTSHRCVLGLLYADYFNGLEALNLSNLGIDREQHAFAAATDLGLNDKGYYRDGALLTAAWKAALAVGSPPPSCPRTVSLTVDQLKELVNRAHASRDAWGDYTDSGLVSFFLHEKGLVL